MYNTSKAEEDTVCVYQCPERPESTVENNDTEELSNVNCVSLICVTSAYTEALAKGSDRQH
jgi:hypothetical protein